MNDAIEHIVIVGGGTAGWLTAGLLATEHQHRLADNSLTITLCESPNIPTIGVGEGTWPTMPQTLRRIGLSETDLIRQCAVSFKQGSKFINWQSEQVSSHYYHPFEVPEGALQGVLAEGWLANGTTTEFAKAFSVQPGLSERCLAPKDITCAQYEGTVNYGYHLDAGSFSELLKKHCINKLGVNHILADVQHVIQHDNGRIAALLLNNKQRLNGDLFVDCTGFKQLLIGETLGIENHKVDDALFADTALAIQAKPCQKDAPIESFTLATAQNSGWVWDIGLPHRRGIGYVYSSSHASDHCAQACLEHYLQQHNLNYHTDFRKIRFQSGYKKQFWAKNCVAVGLSSGFLEPLEASSMVMIELSATMLAEQLPKTDVDMAIISKRFNQTFSYRWQRIVEFLKLHYVLSERPTPFWRDNRDKHTIPERLQELLQLWQYNVPRHFDFDQAHEVFQAASYQYVLFGSGFAHKGLVKPSPEMIAWTRRQQEYNQQRLNTLQSRLPDNRLLIKKIKQYGLANV